MAKRMQEFFGGSSKPIGERIGPNQRDRKARRRLLRIELLEDRRLLTLDTAQWISVGPDAIIGSGNVETIAPPVPGGSVTEGKHGDLHFSLVAHPVFPNVVFVGGDVDKTTNKANIVRIVLGPTVGDEVAKQWLSCRLERSSRSRHFRANPRFSTPLSGPVRGARACEVSVDSRCKSV